MPESITWMYARRSCTTCKKADAYLAGLGVTPAATVDAVKVRYGPADALGLLAGIDTLVAVKGTRVETFDLAQARPDDATLLSKMIGPTGNLRAPTAVVGKTMLVGFHPDAYEATIG